MPESVWDYPRPPRIEPSGRRVRVVLGGAVIADTIRAHRVLETSHPPVYYAPLEDVAPGSLEPSRGPGSFCEWKGEATYFDVIGGDGRRVERAAWTYPDPTPAFEAIRDAVAFYPGLMDECTLDGELVEAQPGGFYGGWITSEVVGPVNGPFTAFAPTDAAFAKVSQATLAALAKNKAKLRAVLLNHGVKGKVTAAQAMKLHSAKTLEGKALSIRVGGGKVIVGGATVIKPNVTACNGVMHVINKVLIPDS